MRVKCATILFKKIMKGMGLGRSSRYLKLICCSLIVLFIPLCSIYSLADDIDPQLSIIAKSLQRQSELSNEIQITGTLIEKRAWPKRVGNEFKETTEISTKKWDVFFARSGEKLRCDLTENFQNFPGKMPASTTDKYIMKKGQLISVPGLQVNPVVFIEEAQRRAFFLDLQQLSSSHYSILSYPLAEELLQGENYTFQIIEEEVFNGSNCIVLHGKMSETRLAKAIARANPKLPLSQDTNISVEIDLWLDTQKDFSVIQCKYHDNRPPGTYIEKAIELGEVELEEYGTIWFPKEVTKKSYIFTGGEKKLVIEISLLVEEITIGKRVEPSLFELDGLGLFRGTKVVDRIKGIDYKWGEDVMTSEAGQQKFKEKELKDTQMQDQLEEQQKPLIRFNRILILTTLLLVVGLGLTIIWRNRRKKK